MDQDSENKKYFGEYLRKERAKVDGHSFKKHYPRNSLCKSTTVTRSISTSICDDCNDQYAKLLEIPVTAIDDYFDEGFWRKASYFNRYSELYYQHNSQTTRSLNNPEKWENVENLLEETALSISKKYNRFENAMVNSYDIPVTGYNLCANNFRESSKSKRMINESWLKWNGKYYNPGYIYQYVSCKSWSVCDNSPVDAGREYREYGYLEIICPRLIGNQDPQLQLGLVEEGNEGGKGQKKELNRIAAGKLTRRDVKRDYLEVDLGSVYELTHIGILGGYPQKLKVFPEREVYERTYHRKSNKYRQWVYTTSNDEISWVCRFSIHYRDQCTGKWYLYEHPFQGNKDVSSEVIHKICLVSRYIRITPLEWHNYREMRIAVYGKNISNHPPTSSKKKKTPLQNDGTEIETIRYVVETTDNGKTLDGYGGRKCSCCEPDLRLRGDLREDMRQSLKDYMDYPGET